jgi:tRNA modification GTPase
VPVVLIDTAGDREAEGEIERRGVELGRARAARADVRVVVRDVGAPDERVDGDLVVWNKIDVGAAPAAALGVSARRGDGLEALRAAVLARVLGERGEGSEEALVSTERQRALVEAASEAAARGSAAARAGRPAELVAVDVREAANALGAVVGVDVGEAMLDALFARFCIGK